MLRRIVLKNFKQHTSLETEFSPGLNTVRGPNAAGKSTLLTATLYAMFGAGAVSSSKDNLKTWGVSGPMSVTLELDLPELGAVRIERSERSAKMYGEEDKLVASGHTPVTRTVEDALGLDAKTFRLLATSPQGEASALLTLGASTLQKRLEEVAKVDVLDQVLVLCGKDVTHMEGQLAGIGEIADPKGYEQLLETAEQRLSEKQQELATAKVQTTEAQQESDRLQAAYQAANKAMTAWSRASTALEFAERQVQSVEEQVSQISRTLGEFPSDLPEKERQSAEQVNEWATIVNEITEIKKENDDKENALRRMYQQRDQLQALKAESDQYAKRLAPKLQELSELSERILASSSRYNALLATEKDISKALDDAVCPACGRPYEEGHDRAAAEQELTKVRAQIGSERTLQNALRADQEVLSEEVETLRRKVNPALQTQLERLEDEIEVERMRATRSWVSQREEFAGEGDGVNLEDASKIAWEHYNRLRAVYDKVVQENRIYQSHSRDLEKAQTCLAAAKERVSEAGAEAARLHKDVEAAGDPQDLEQRWNAAVALFRGLNQKVLTLTGESVTLQNEVSGYKRQLKALQEALEKRKQVEGQMALVKELQAYLRKNRARLAREIWDGLLIYTSDLIHRVTEGRLSNLRREDSGEFLVTEHGAQEVPVSELSGAQKAIVGTCLRLSISHVFYGPLGVLLLDEVSADMDDSNAAATAGLLMSLESQIVMVTHRQGDAMQAGNVVELRA